MQETIVITGFSQQPSPDCSLQSDQHLQSTRQINDKSNKERGLNLDAAVNFNNDQNISILQGSQQQNPKQGNEIWPELSSIIIKISKIQKALATQRKNNALLIEKSNQKTLQIKNLSNKIRQLTQELQSNNVDPNGGQQRCRQLQEQLMQKQSIIKQQTFRIEEFIYNQVIKKTQIQEKNKKHEKQIKQIFDRIRKANIELERQREVNKRMRLEMSEKIGALQSTKQEYLLQEISKLKEEIHRSRDEKEICLYGQIDELNRKIYQLEEDNKKKTILLLLIQRKKQQTINELVEKKDAEIKTNKVLYKSVLQKMHKMQQQMSKLQQQIKRNKLSGSFERHNILFFKAEQEISFELSPEKK